MKNLIFIVLIAVAGIAGYNFINKPAANVEPVTVQTEAIVNAAEDTDTEASAEATLEEAVTADEGNLMTPADMSEEAQTEMYGFMMEYNKCMMTNRAEYHQNDITVEDAAGITFEECAPTLDSLKAVLATNGVNKGLQEGMVKTLEQRASRKLMSAIMQSKAAASMSAPPVMPAVTTP